LISATKPTITFNQGKAKIEEQHVHVFQEPGNQEAVRAGLLELEDFDVDSSPKSTLETWVPSCEHSKGHELL
jgi:hypothetical protein